MGNCTNFINKENNEYDKIALKGVIHTYCDKNVVIYDSKVFESFGMISFINKGYCSVEIYKNNMSCPITVVEPGDSFTLTSNSFFKVEIRCRSMCNCNIYEPCEIYYDYEDYEIYETCKCKTKCVYKRDYDCPMSTRCITCKKRRFCKECKLHYEGYVYIKFDCDPSSILEC